LADISLFKAGKIKGTNQMPTGGEKKKKEKVKVIYYFSIPLSLFVLPPFSLFYATR